MVRTLPSKCCCVISNGRVIDPERATWTYMLARRTANYHASRNPAMRLEKQPQIMRRYRIVAIDEGHEFATRGLHASIARF